MFQFMPSLTLSMALFVTVVGCGPASSDDPSSRESPVGTSEASRAPATPVPASNPAADATPLLLTATPSPPLERKLVVPDWMATLLTSPDVRVRLQALDTWVRQRQIGSVDPLMLALNDPDERVQTRALALIEQDWLALQARQGKTTP